MNYKKIHPDLPIFIIPFNKCHILYCAGKIWVLSKEYYSNCKTFFEKNNYIDWQNAPLYVQELYRHAQYSQNQWYSLIHQPFELECFTVYISYDCNMNCSYCYNKQNRDKKGLKVNLEYVEAVGRYAAQECRQRQRDLVFVLHGGGEPTYHWSYMQSIYHTVRKIASEYKIRLYSYIATNGLFTPQKALWLTENIGHIGISCDGPSEIQSVQRYSKQSQKQIEIIKANAKTILDAGGKLDVRTTITPKSSSFQSQIVTFLSEDLRANMIHFEPVYRQENDGFNVNDAEQFVHDFLLAQKIAKERNSILLYSGVRPSELHSSYCDVFRNTIRLLPEGIISNCFYYSVDKLNHILQIGEYDLKNKKFNILPNNIAELKHRMLVRPQKCLECINQLHCSMGCPDSCLVCNPNNIQNNFRCKVNQLLTLNWIFQTVEKAKVSKQNQLYGIPVEYF